MLPDEFNEQIIKLEAGELSGEEIERLKAAAAERPEAGEYLESIERAMATASDALNVPPSSNDAFAEKVMIAVRREQSAQGFRMEPTARSRIIRLQRRILFVLTAIISCVILIVVIQLTSPKPPRVSLPANDAQRIGSIAPVGDGAVIIAADGLDSGERPLKTRFGLYPGDAVRSGDAYAEAAVRIDPQGNDIVFVSFNRGASAVFTGRDSLTLNDGTLFINRGPDGVCDLDYRVIASGVEYRISPHSMVYLSVTHVGPDQRPPQTDESPSGAPQPDSAERMPSSNAEISCVIVCSVYNGSVRAASPSGDERLIRNRESVQYSQGKFETVDIDRFSQLRWYDDLAMPR